MSSGCVESVGEGGCAESVGEQEHSEQEVLPLKVSLTTQEMNEIRSLKNGLPF